MTYQFHPAAASEHLDSIAFYESRLAGLGAAFRLAEEVRSFDFAALPVPSKNRRYPSA